MPKRKWVAYVREGSGCERTGDGRGFVYFKARKRKAANRYLNRHEPDGWVWVWCCPANQVSK